MTQIENNLDFYFLVDNIYPNQSFSVHISSHTKSIILQTHQTQISLFYKTHQCLEKLKKKNIETQTKAKQSTWTKTLKYKHWNLEEYKTEQRGFAERERERENVVTCRGRSWWTDWILMSALVRDELVGGARSLLGWVLLSIDVITREIMRWTEPLEFDVKAGFQKKLRKWFYVGSEREVGQMSEWGSWVLSNGIWRKCKTLA